MIMTREMEIELAQRCSDPYDAFHWRGNKYFYWPFVWINYSLNCHLRIFIIITLRERERERERKRRTCNLPRCRSDPVLRSVPPLAMASLRRISRPSTAHRRDSSTNSATGCTWITKNQFHSNSTKKIQKWKFWKLEQKIQKWNFQDWNKKKSKNMKYFESDGTAGIADDVDDVLAAGILHVLPVHFEQPVAGQQGNVHLLVTGHRFGEDHRPLNNTP